MMLRRIAAVLAGLLAWIVIATVINRLLRLGMDGYAAAEPTMAFTLPMMWARLAMAAACSLAAGLLAARIAARAEATAAPRMLPVALLLGIVLLLFFLPVHYQLWSRFPAWYHLLFLASLPLLTWQGGRIAAGRITGGPSAR